MTKLPAVPGFVLVAVRAQPRARRTGITGSHTDATGRRRLSIAVSEPPEDGRASRAVCAVLARALDVPPSRVSVQSGMAAREKILRIEGDAAVLAQRLNALLDEYTMGSGSQVLRD